ncbi:MULTISPECIES: ASCH domain-containing protein [Pseudanabaena]|jgi:hypothetical protein|uniref:ASCH domain-containing protein n=1 Tax=Pseudanabaena TaxID=1152 RepID=UPI00247A5BD1|nr:MULTISPECIES: ASCH domain-containing protein [Pseudanabaena]MEA5489304.1 ASCH domain-containing protein [Pseudanabaena sp. CCNP1317]WGS74102.1 ASCH domain-containing protein [Pseudanabaena galeata CCNP1313]
MPVLSFSVHKEKIKSGAKRHTIRALRKFPIKVGDKLYLWWKQRSPEREKLGEAKCIKVSDVLINADGVNIDDKIIINKIGLDNFAIADGFNDWQQLIEFFDKDGLPFEGVLIQWDNIKSPF